MVRLLPRPRLPQRVPRYAPALRRRVSRQQAWRIPVSVCIAAGCAGGDIIVTASDTLLTWGHTSTESGFKQAQLFPGWSVMVAGDDITVGAEDVIREVHDTLAAYGPENNPTLLQVKSALLGAWRETQNRVGASAVLNPLGLTFREFLKTGREKLGEVLFVDLARQLEVASRLQCQLLVCGFDDRRRAHFLALDDDSGCRDFTRNRFLAIGSGHTSALSESRFP